MLGNEFRGTRQHVHHTQDAQHTRHPHTIHTNMCADIIFLRSPHVCAYSARMPRVISALCVLSSASKWIPKPFGIESWATQNEFIWLPIFGSAEIPKKQMPTVTQEQNTSTISSGHRRKPVTKVIAIKSQRRTMCDMWGMTIKSWPPFVSPVVSSATPPAAYPHPAIVLRASHAKDGRGQPAR